jgi:hypothetical protein
MHKQTAAHCKKRKAITSRVSELPTADALWGFCVYAQAFMLVVRFAPAASPATLAYGHRTLADPMQCYLLGVRDPNQRPSNSPRSSSNNLN